MNRSRPNLFAVLLTLIVLVVVGIVYLYSGAYNVAATQEHTALGSWVLTTAKSRAIAVRADDVPEPPSMDSAAAVSGFEKFRSMCIACHGAPGVERGEFGKGITPTPPALSEKASEYSERELFWILNHGIKLAGMPAFGRTHSDVELWEIVHFLDLLADMDAEAYESWNTRYPPSGGAHQSSSPANAGQGH